MKAAEMMFQTRFFWRKAGLGDLHSTCWPELSEAHGDPVVGSPAAQPLQLIPQVSDGRRIQDMEDLAHYWSFSNMHATARLYITVSQEHACHSYTLYRTCKLKEWYHVSFQTTCAQVKRCRILQFSVSHCKWTRAGNKTKINSITQAPFEQIKWVVKFDAARTACKDNIAQDIASGFKMAFFNTKLSTIP